MAQSMPPEPKRLGGFELLGRLGKGGMGTVLKARQVSMDRLVALKILPKNLAENEAFVARFLREARSAAKLRHPNIVQAYDVGQAEGYYYFAMEFVDGETLSEIIRRDGPLDPNRALDIMKQVASALAAADKEGIVHRDIKPSNIMLDKEGQVRVTDFGLAKRTEGDVEVTADGAVVGTPAYVAPEIAKGGEADARSDLYSLGATIFCALAGRPPFEGKNFSEVLIKQATEPAPPLATLAPRVDRRLCHIIDRLLRKNPEARYPSANALLEDLNGLGKLQSVAAPRAEGRAALAEAPTLEMTEGQRARVGRASVARVASRAGDSPPTKLSKTTLIVVAAIVACIAIAGLIFALRPSRKPASTAISVPEHRTPIIEHPKGLTAKPPEDAKKTSVPQRPTPTTQHPVVAPVPKPKETPEPKAAPPPPPKEDTAVQAKWEAIKAEAQKLAEAGKFDEALKTIEGAKALPLEGIADLVAESIESIESIRSTRLKAALAAYQAESDKLWALFKARDYAAADKLLASLAADPRFVGGASAPRVTPRAGDGPPTIQDMLNAELEAAKLLKEFWATVERGVAARKGTISIAGALGNVTAVENGVITLQTPKEAVTRRVVDLTAKQALAYAAVAARDDERSRLAEAIFRIAEAEDPALADKALAAAGNPPGLAVYKDRLAALTLGAAEVAARKAWAEIEAAAKPKPTKAEAARLLALLDAFEKSHAGTKHFASVRDKLPAIRERAAGTTEAVEPAAPPADIPPERAADIGLEQGFAAAYYAGQNHDRFVTAAVGKGPLSFNWGTNAPAPGVPADGFSCRFVGWLYVDETADYGFAFWHDDGVRLYVDGKSVVDYWVAKPGHSPTGNIWLEKGWHRFWVEHFDGPWTATVSLLWRKGSAAETKVPAEVLYCESELLERIRRNPARDPLLGMKPTDRASLQRPKRGAEQPKPGEWQSLFDGKTLKGWRVLREGAYAGGGEVTVSDGAVQLGAGSPRTGICPTGRLPTLDYELALEAMRVEGNEGFASIVFPIRSTLCLLIVGAADGRLITLDLVKDETGRHKDPARRVDFQNLRWYEVRLRVTAARIEAWVDQEKVVDLATAGHTFEVPSRLAQGSEPFTICASKKTKAALRNIRIRRIEPGSAAALKAGG